MEANLPVSSAGDTPPMEGDTSPPPGSFPYATWGPAVALMGMLMALVAGLLLQIPVFVIDNPGPDGDDLSSASKAAAQFATALGFIVVPLVIAARGVAISEALKNLGLRAFRVWSGLGWMAAAVGAYLVFAAVYVAIFGEPKQEDIAEEFGALPVQILLIVFMAGISEEICFRGMLFGGLRTRLPMLWAALISAAIFGLLHAATGLSAVPPLIALGFIFALLYEKTGSIVPGILIHMLNNSVALLAQ